MTSSILQRSFAAFVVLAALTTTSARAVVISYDLGGDRSETVNLSNGLDATVEVNADTSIGKAQKAKMLQELNRALKDAQPIQHRGNIDLVKSYFEKIEAAVE